MMGVNVIDNGVNMTLSGKLNGKCEVILYEKNSDDEAARIPFLDEHVIGNVYSMRIEGMEYGKYDYNFSIDGEVVTDLYAKALTGKKEWNRIPDSVRGMIVKDDFEWDGDVPLKIPFDETIIYRLHVRGFTKHSSSKSRHSGTYLGIVDKIPHLKELGITMVELMPAYEFNEVKGTKQPSTSMKGQFLIDSPILNYWGYTDGYAFAPKASFAYTDKAGGEVEEFKHMVKELHRNGIEVSMEFFFPQNTNPKLILDALHYWVLEYHIDGIHVNCDDAVMKMIETDNLLCTTKIFTYCTGDNEDYYNGYQLDNGSNYGCIHRTRNIADFNDDFMVAARRFIKGDEDMLNTISYKIKANPSGKAVVNYVANHNSFTLYDMVSYDRKYNEANGENNKDGAVYNYSWNCGAEGETKKRKITELRKKQIKNALSLVFLSQGIPMIYAGDEMCNSQKGNNNPYCLDNEISWMNWNTSALAKEIFEFTKMLITFRKQHKVLHMKKEPRQMDYKSVGLPDLSFHGTKAWYADFSNFNRHFSAMYCGKYGMPEDDSDILIAYNMFWDDLKFGAPSARGKKKWQVVLATDNNVKLGEFIEDRMFEVPARSVIILIAKGGSI